MRSLYKTGGPAGPLVIGATAPNFDYGLLTARAVAAAAAGGVASGARIVAAVALVVVHGVLVLW